MRLDRKAVFCDSRVNTGQLVAIDNPTHPHSGFSQLFNVSLPLQVPELVAELIIATVVNKKSWDEISPTYLTTSSPTSGMYLFNVAISLE